MGLRKSKQEQLNESLLKACMRGASDEVEKLLDEGAEYTREALYIAIWHGKAETVKLLVEKHPEDINRPSSGGSAGLDYNRFYLDRGCTPLLLACRSGELEIFDLLQQHGADTTAVDSDGETALHYAARHGNFPIVQKLLERGADINALDHHGNKAETLAEKNHKGIADFLREKAATANPKTAAVKDGWTISDDGEVTLVSEKKNINYRLTEIFNFETRTYSRLACNLETGGESQSFRFFDECPDKKIIEDAYRIFTGMGGKADASAITGAVIKKAPRLG